MLSTSYTRISCTVCWVISVEYLDVFSSKVSSKMGAHVRRGALFIGYWCHVIPSF